MQISMKDTASSPNGPEQRGVACMVSRGSSAPIIRTGAAYRERTKGIKYKGVPGSEGLDVWAHSD